jgi:hypothetical protein
MSDVTSFLNEAASAHQKLSNEARKMADKWEKSGLLEGLEGHERNSMAVLLENQAGQLLNEASATQTTAGLESWAGVALPLVRKVLGQIAAKNFVSVQPMNLPAGLVFFMDFQYNNARGDRAVGESIYGVTSGSGTLPRDGFYGAGRFGYSVNQQQLTGQTIKSNRVALPADLDYETTSSSTTYAVYRVSVSSLTRPDLEGIRSFTVSGSGEDFSQALPQFTRLVTVSTTNDTIEFVAPTGSAAETLQTVNYSQQPVETNRGDFEDRDPIQGGSSPDGTNLNIPEINIQLRSETIAAKTRKLKAVWSPELAQDLNAYHSIDAEAELTAMLSDHISLEIDLEILDMLVVNATTTDYWSAKIGEVWNGSSFTDVNTGTAWTNMTWFQTLGQKMQRVSNKIHQLTLRGGANFAVVSPTVATILETIPGFMAGTNGDKMEFAAGVSQVGSFQNRFQIYKNPYMTENIVLMGFRGANFLETGAVYAPYIPLLMTPLVYDPDNFTPRRGVMTRYAKKVVRPEFFGKVVINGLEFV